MPDTENSQEGQPQRLTRLLATMHDGRWAYDHAQGQARLEQGHIGPIIWTITAKLEDADGLPESFSARVICSWRPHGKGSGDHEMRLHLSGTLLDIAQGVMARVPVFQRAVEAAFWEGMRSHQGKRPCDEQA